MAVVIIADVMDLLDATIANLAGPSIRADLGGGESTLQWVLAAYTHGLRRRAGHLGPGRRPGRAAPDVHHRHGRLHASPRCCAGWRRPPALLIAFRVLQGLFGAVMIPQGLAMVKQSFHPDDLQKAFIPFGPIMGLAAVLGPILAGFLHRRRPVRHRLADDLPHQRPGRRRRRRTSPRATCPTIPRDRERAARRPRVAAAGRRLGAADLPAGAGSRARLAGLVLPA